jgi:midasin
MQILRKKVDEWNQVAHRLNNFKDIEAEIATLIQRWMKLELQCWRGSLSQTLDIARGKAYRYWFFLYNLIHEFLLESTIVDGDNANELDFIQIEKDFVSEDATDDKLKSTKNVSLQSLTNVLKQFIESSNYAEFDLRMGLLKSFEIYLLKMSAVSSSSLKKSSQAIAVIHNLHDYFDQFSYRVKDFIQTVRKPIEDKLRKFVKINSFDKDLSYFSTESNIKTVHRNLHKHFKEFEIEIKKKITDLFIFKDSSTELDSSHNSEKNKVAISMELFVASDDFLKSIIPLDENSKYSSKAQKLIKNILSNVNYNEHLDSMNELISMELETCNHLRALKVDENLPRNKQKSQAKSILNQKRKSLNDFFKTMSKIGINFKSGLLSYSINSQAIDFNTNPFVIDKLNFNDPNVKAYVSNINSKLDLYFNKSIFKYKLLMNFLLMPRNDIDFGFLERMKGLSIDLFTLAQEQRKSLSNSVNKLRQLKQHIIDIEIVQSSSNVKSFKNELLKVDLMRDTVLHAIEILEQFKLLMKCAPEKCESDNLKVIVSTKIVLHQKSQIYDTILKSADNILSDLQRDFIALSNQKSRFIQNGNELVQQFKSFASKLTDLKQLFVNENDEYSTFGRPILELNDKVSQTLERIESINSTLCDPYVADSSQNCEKLTHLILLVVQNIYKEYITIERTQNIKDENDEVLKENVLKILLHENISKDIQKLNLNKINELLAEFIQTLFETHANSDSHKHTIESIYSFVKQYELLSEYFFLQQLSVNKVTTKMLSIMLSVFLELAKNGFCVPEHLLSDEEQKQEGDTKTGEGFGFEDGEGENNVSNKLESEDQLDEAKKPEDYNKNDKDDEKDCKEEDGIDMSENFEGKMQDLTEQSDEEENNEDENEKEEIDKEMGETEEGADKLDEQIWGDDEQNEAEENPGEQKEEDGKFIK